MVTKRVTEFVVNVFKVVKISHQQAKRGVGSFCPVQHDVVTMLKGPVVGKAGQAVGGRHHSKFFMGLPQFDLDRYLGGD